MGGWIVSIIQGTREGVKEDPGQIVVSQVEDPFDLEAWVQEMSQTVETKLQGPQYERLRDWLESEGVAASVIPWAVFRD